MSARTDHRTAEGGLAGQVQGRDIGSEVSLILVCTDEVGAGPALHRHPYSETFVIRSGEVEFTVEGRSFPGRAGEVVVVQAGDAHRFVNRGTDRLEMVNVHAGPEIITEWLE